MPVSTAQFWSLLAESRLAGTDALWLWQRQFAAQGAAASAEAAAEWLVGQQRLTRYQATVLLHGRAGPFFFSAYRVLDRLTAGSLAGWFRAVHDPTGHPVLLGFLAGKAAKDVQAGAAAAKPLLDACRVTHPQLQRFYELVDLGSYTFVVAEDPAGESVAEQLAGGPGRLTPHDACRVVRVAALGLQALHRAGLVHGDIRPVHLWAEPPDNIKLMRRPLLPAPLGEPELDERGDYLAPELARGGQMPTVQGDIYALGCTLYQLIAGRPPFAGGDRQEKLRRHAREAIQPLDPYGTPRPVAEIVAYMMAKNPSVRFSRLDEVLEQLTPFVDPRRSEPLPADTATSAAYASWLGERPAVVAVPPAPPPPLAVRFPSPEIVVQARPSSGPAAEAIAGIAPAAGAAAPSRRAQRRARRRKPAALLAPWLLVPAVLLAAVGAYGLQHGWFTGREAASVSPAVSEAVSPSAPDSSPTSAVVGSDSGGTAEPLSAATALWESPTAGAPIALAYAPPGSQVFLVARPADLVALEEGRRLLEALGPAFVPARQAWEAAAGVSLEMVELLVMSLHDQAEQFPRPAFVVRLKEPLTPEQLVARWSNAQAVGDGPQRTYVAGPWSFYIPESGAGRHFVMASAAQIKEVLEFEGAPPALRREMARLVRTTDEQRHVSLLFAPGYLSSELLRDGREWYFGPTRQARESIEWLLGETLKAGCFSLHLGDQFYWELRAYGQAELDSFQLSSDLRDRVSQIPERIESYMAQINPPEYWRLIAFRYPTMIRFLHRHTRIGVEDEQAVVNCRLPLAAAHNLVLGGELALSAAVSDGGTTTAAAQTQAPRSYDELLQTTMSLSFDQKSLEAVIADLAAEIKDSYPSLSFEFGLRIIGEDLETEGITRNQQIANFREDRKPLAEILTAVVRRANPVTTVQDPAENDQKLIWVVGPDPDQPARAIILITTRVAAGAKKYALPLPFRPK